MKSLLLSATLLLAPAVLVAQTATPPSAPSVHQNRRSNPHKAAARLGYKLQLSPDQQARIEPILAARKQQVQAVRANMQLSEADRRQQVKQIRHQSRAQLSNVLTPDQMRRMKALHHAHHAAATPPTGV